MLPNSRKLPPPSSSSAEYQRVDSGHRKRSLSAAAQTPYNQPEQRQNSKALFSRLRSGSQNQSTEHRLGPPPSNSYSSHSASSIPSSRSTTLMVDLPIEADQKVKRKPLFTENNGSNCSSNSSIAERPLQDKPVSDLQPHAAGIPFSSAAANAAVTPSDATVSRKASQKGAKGVGGGIGRFFRKLSRASEDDDMLDDAPKVRPISMSPSAHIASRTPNPHNIPLAPAPPPQQNCRHSAFPSFPSAAGSAVYPTLYDNAPQRQQLPSAEHIASYHHHHHHHHQQQQQQHNHHNHVSPMQPSIVPTTTTPQIPNSATLPNPNIRRYENDNTTVHNTRSSIKPSATFPRISKEEKEHHRYQHALPEKQHERHSSESKSSTAWLSLYSTFASDSENALDNDPYLKDDLVHIVSQNVQRRPQVTRAASTPLSGNDSSSSVTDSASIDSYNTMDTALDSNEYSDNDDEDAREMLSNLTIDEDTTFTTTMASIKEEEHCSVGSDRVDEDDDVFVDATGFSQDDIKREQTESKLSKRLSGGHYGSAGGLMIATAPTNLDASKQQKRKSRPPPEDIAKAMLDWKRQSGGTSKRLSGINKWNNFIDNRESTGTVVDLRVKQEDDEEDKRELSLPDKQALRDQAAETLMGNKSTVVAAANSSTLSPPQQQQSNSSSHQRTPSINQLSFAFSKSLDAAWNDPNPEIAKVFDPRLSTEQQQQQQQQQPEQAPPAHFNKDAQEAARRLWQEDETLCPRERIAEWLGSGKPLNSDALNYYMEYFEFGRMRLDSAFRKLCSKLYFKAEAQQIDRILEVFAQRYWSCNPDSIYKTADVVYAVVYSVLLLNTDLHVAQGNYNRMTRYEFIKNTIAAIHDQPSVSNEIKKGSDVFTKAWETELESHLKELYSSVKQYQILQPLSARSSSNRDSIEKRGSLLASKRVVGLKRSVGSIIRRSARESMLFADDIQPPRTSTSSLSRPSSPQPKSPRRRSVSSIGSAASFGFGGQNSSLSPTYQPMINFMDMHGNVLFRNQPPYIKEGVVIRKHLLEKANQKAKHRDWKECLLVVDRGELRMYALHHTSESERRSIIRASSASFASLGDSAVQSNDSHHDTASFGGIATKNGTNKWVSHSQLLGTIPMSHTLSNALPPPGYNRHRPHVFAIQQPDGGVYLFQAASAEQVNEWVATCNYWAARESKEPLPGGVSNMEYGWGSCLNDVILDLDAVENNAQTTGNYLQDPDSVTIYEWRPPVPPSVPSTLNEKEQYEALLKHLQGLNEEINHHRELKKKLLVKFPSKSSNHAKAMANWDAKSKYLLHDIIKYQNYCDVLEKSIQQQEKQGTKIEDAAPSATGDTSIDLSYSASRVDLMKEIGEELQLAF